VKKNLGDEVAASEVVAETYLPGKVHPMNVANLLGVVPADLPRCMVRKEGEAVQRNEVLARSTSFFGLFKNEVTAKVEGTLENVSTITGQVMVREKPTPVQVRAFVDGTVVEIIPQEGVVLETTATYIQGIFGIGGETQGRITVLVEAPGEELTAESIRSEHAGQVLVGGAFASLAALRKAVEVGAAGVVVGGIDALDLVEFMGYDLGVAITGSERLGLTLIVTEGFGHVAMAERTFSLLTELSGSEASINGSTQIRAGVIRPEIIVTRAREQREAPPGDELKGLEVGDLVRIIRQPHFGELGTVTSLPHELSTLESESRARVLEVTLATGQILRLPRANTEVIAG